jgi:hypothetical protein
MYSNEIEFQLANISIEDEGMEDLETFNLKFGEKFLEINKKYEDISLNENIINKPLGLIDKSIIRKFSVKKFFYDCLININKKQLKQILNELGKIEELNFETLSNIKSIRSRSTKVQLIEIINKIIIELIKFKN